MKKLLFFLVLAFYLNGKAQIISTIAGTNVYGYSGDGGLASNAKLNPVTVAADAVGNIYISDGGNVRIRKISTNGIITTIAGNGNSGYTGDGGAATNATLNNSWGVAADAFGNVFIADNFNNCIRKINSAGIITTVAGTGTQGYSGDGGPATGAQLYYTRGVTVDAAGNLYICDSGNNCIRKVSTNGIITTVAGTGVQGFSGDGGQATNAQLGFPNAMVLDPAGNMYIADTYNNRIRKINTSGIITTFAGTGTQFGNDHNQPATSASVLSPMGIAIDFVGNIYITIQYNSSYGNARVLVVDTNGIINFFAGSGSYVPCQNNVPATSACVGAPIGITTDINGNVYFVDAQNVRKITHCSNPISISTNNLITATCSTSVSLTASGAYTYTWSPANLNNPNIANPTTSPMLTNTIYKVLGIDASGKCGASSSDTVNIAAPIVSYTITQSAPLTWDIYPTYIGTDSANWYWGDGTSSTGLYPSHTYSAAGRYNICVTAYSLCGDTAQSCQNDTVYRTTNGNMVQVNVLQGQTTGIQQVANSNNINIYPNPNNGSFLIETSSNEKQTLQIFDVNGKLVLTQTINGKTNIDASILNEGIYNLSIIGNQGIINKRVAIVK